ncbi:serine hydrolase [candidate division WWE3 bacterium]|nr:serine hydrolase [candidate division WWE3 bacterium]
MNKKINEALNLATSFIRTPVFSSIATSALIVAILASTRYQIVQTASGVTIAQSKPTPTPSIVAPTPTSTILDSSTSTINELVHNFPGKAAIVITNLNDFSKQYSVNDHEIFETASLYKLWVMATVYQEIERGTLTEDEVLIEATSESPAVTIKDAVRQMITVSDNPLATTLVEKVGFITIKNFLTEHQMTDSILGTPAYTSAHDINLFWELLYQRKLANTSNTTTMVSMLLDQQLNEGLPRYVEPSVLIAHKTGYLNGLFHDAGVVYLHNRPYAVSVLSQSDQKDAGQELAGQITKTLVSNR